jgi:hypothetical protein
MLADSPLKISPLASDTLVCARLAGARNSSFCGLLPREFPIRLVSRIVCSARVGANEFAPKKAGRDQRNPQRPFWPDHASVFSEARPWRSVWSGTEIGARVRKSRQKEAAGAADNAGRFRRKLTPQPNQSTALHPHAASQVYPDHRAGRLGQRNSHGQNPIRRLDTATSNSLELLCEEGPQRTDVDLAHIRATRHCACSGSGTTGKPIPHQMIHFQSNFPINLSFSQLRTLLRQEAQLRST